MKMRIQKLHPLATVPQYATDGAACFDLHAILENTITLFQGESIVIGTGLAFEIPEGWTMLIYGRSGHAFKHGTRLGNSVAVIDHDYRGEVMIKLTREYSAGTDAMTICQGDRIAQAMLVQVPHINFEVCEQLSITDRGQGGLGSTGN